MEKKPVLFMLLFAGSVLLIFLLMQPILVFYSNEISLLFPKGWIAFQQRNLLLIIQAIMLLVVIPVYFLTFYFSWKYRADNKKAKYEPYLEDSISAEIIWWGLPTILVIIIATLTWIKTYELDPFRPIESDKKAMTIQVVALQWKWLFLYPEENIATLNFVHFPEKTPIRFVITADAPMNSFWIPQLGGQIYAMPSMKTELNLIADETGEFRGSSANISGEGFASMHFIAKASTENEFQQWLQEAKQSSGSLGRDEYKELAQPSKGNPPTTYRLAEQNLFSEILMKFMHPVSKL